jgi:hypothetical protein
MAYVFFTLIFVIVSYLSWVFLAPDITKTIEGAVWLSGTTDEIREFKNSFDDIVTDIPSVAEFKSWAIDIGNTVKWGLNTTKGKIDDIRVTLSWAQDSINNTFDAIDSTIESVKWAKETVQKFNESNEWLIKLWDSIRWTVNTDDVSDATATSQ